MTEQQLSPRKLAEIAAARHELDANSSPGRAPDPYEGVRVVVANMPAGTAVKIGFWIGVGFFVFSGVWWCIHQLAVIACDHLLRH